MKSAWLLPSAIFLTACASVRNSPPLQFINNRLGEPTTADLNFSSARKKYVAAHANLDPKISQAVIDGKVIAGMSEEDVRIVMGNPSSRDMHEVDSVSIETWNYCFGRTIYNADFVNGIVKETASREGDYTIYDCRDASHQMWVMRRGRDAGK